MDSSDFLNKSKKAKEDQTQVFALDANSYKIAKAMEADEKEPQDDKGGSLKLILDSLRKSEKAREHDIRLAFTLDPRDANLGTVSTYRQKTNLTPDPILKRIAGPQGDDLVNQILQARSNTLASFGRPRTSRFSVGFEFQQMHPEPHETPDQQKEIQKRIEKIKEVMWNCGSNRVIEDWHPNLSQFLKMTTRDALLFGRSATEFIYANDTDRGENVCVAFRAVDAGTIYRIIPSASHDQEQRIAAMRMLEKLDDKKFDISKYEKDEYKWVQVINGTPVQVFTEKELVVYNIFPTTNIEYNGYPLTPIDQALNAVITHISISLQNKLFFENGRAARGMLVFKSDDIDEGTIQKIRNQFHASINSVKNSYRMPVFGIGSEDDIIFQTTDSAGRDKEFQFLSDDTARIVLGAFQMSPEELPGYAHLSRGSNSQTLSETSNEYKLIAARDVGLRPLMYDIQDLLNTHILPKFDEEFSKEFQLILAGLEQDDPEKESTRLSQDMNVHMTMDDILKTVEKPVLGKELGGQFIMNQQWQTSVAPYLTVGFMMEAFFGIEGAAQDPRYDYIRDPFYFQQMQLAIQKSQMAMQNQQMAMQMQQPQQQPQPGQDGQDSGQEASGDQDTGQPAQKSELAATFFELNKSVETNHTAISKMLLARHNQIVDKNLLAWRKDSEKAVRKIVADIQNGTLAKNEDHEDCDHDHDVDG